MKSIKPKPTSRQDEKKQIMLIHKLAVRLPWIVVIAVILTALITIIEVYLSQKGH